MKGFLVAGSASGVGKTIVSLALMSAFCSRGYRVQAFKCGPDFLDTGHHSKICKRRAHNLDTWMIPADKNIRLFESASADADIAIVEGAMGLFDGVSGEEETGSAAEIAKLLDLPVVLVLDASASGRSLAAVVKGFTEFDSNVRFAGLVLNRVAGESHYRLLQAAIAASSSISILGWLPKEQSIGIPERHLGLHVAEEFCRWDERRALLGEFAERHLDLESLAKNAALSRFVRVCKPQDPDWPEPAVRIGIARDSAFSFYYEANFDCLEACGAELVPFSPLADSSLPQSLDALYFGGGYPELYAAELSANVGMLRSLEGAARKGIPIYGECGGMMYLSESLRGSDGKKHRMAGLLPLETEMTDRLQRFGYVQLEFLSDCLLGPRGTTTRGHSFHYSRCAEQGLTEKKYRVSYTLSGREEIEGYQRGKVMGSYLHLHFLANPSLAESFVAQARVPRREVL